LVLPDVLLEGAEQDVPQVFKPAFDRLWQASGYLRSFAYQNQGGALVWTGVA
jgi:hypothetical protein